VSGSHFLPCLAFFPALNQSSKGFTSLEWGIDQYGNEASLPLEEPGRLGGVSDAVASLGSFGSHAVAALATGAADGLSSLKANPGESDEEEVVNDWSAMAV
jgi:hypothetical protein